MLSEIKKSTLSSLVRASIREARFTVSPMTVYSMRPLWPSLSSAPMLPATTGPVWMPMPVRKLGSCSRVSSRLSAASRSRIDSPARTACSASSGRGRGGPHTAITQSPMNLSTVPPCALTAATIAVK